VGLDITEGKDEKSLIKNVQDAILTALKFPHHIPKKPA